MQDGVAASTTLIMQKAFRGTLNHTSEAFAGVWNSRLGIINFARSLTAANNMNQQRDVLIVPSTGGESLFC
jgi:hypothetical protein